MWKIQKLKLQISVLFSLSSEQCKERVSEPRQQPGAESPSWTWEHAGQERALRGRGNTPGRGEPFVDVGTRGARESPSWTWEHAGHERAGPGTRGCPGSAPLCSHSAAAPAMPTRKVTASRSCSRHLRVLNRLY